MIIPTKQVIKLQEFLLSETYRVLTRQNQIDLMQTLQAEQQAHNELREKLKTIEWCGVPGNDICFVCNGDRKHDADCWLGNAINRKVVD
jgi:hypothetical protein